MRRSGLGERLFIALCLLAMAVPLAMLAVLVGDILIDAWPRLSTHFLTSMPSRRPELAGVLPALMGTAMLVGVTAVVALPIGVGAAIYLEEYGTRSRLANLIELNIANLAGVPSVIYGLLGLDVFVRTVGLGRSVLAGGLTLALLILPIVIMSAREALRMVPISVREGGAALGATRWQTTWRLVLPMALPGTLTGAILALSRAIGETAPLIVVGAATYVTFLPRGLDSPFTALPMQIFEWVSRPERGFQVDAAAGIVALLLTLLAMNAFAIVLRNRYQKRVY
jgi:phosphate transport system permease protein